MIKDNIILIFVVSQHIHLILHMSYIILRTLPFIYVVLFMQRSPWEANQEASLETPYILLNPKAQYQIYESSPPVTVRSHISLVRTQPIHVIY
jgi:hypothetical protein